MSGKLSVRPNESKLAKDPAPHPKKRGAEPENTDRTCSNFFTEIDPQNHTAANQPHTLSQNSFTDAFFSLDHRWRFAAINSVAEQIIFHKSAKLLLGKSYWKEFPQDIGSVFDRRYHEALQHNQPVHFEGYSQITGGWFEAHAYPYADHLDVYLRDITAQKESEECLAYQAYLFENAQDAIAAMDTRQHITAWNHAAEKLFEWKSEDVLGSELSQVIPIDWFNRRVYPDLQTGTWPMENPAEISITTRSGKHISVEARVAPLLTATRQTSGFVCTFLDITQHRTIHTALPESEEGVRPQTQPAQYSLDKLEAVINSMAEAVTIGDLEGNLLAINPAALRLYGFNRIEEMKTSMRELSQTFTAYRLDGSPLSYTDWPMMRAARGEPVKNLEMRIQRADTGKDWVGLFSATPVKNERGDTVLIVVTTVNVTRQRRRYQNEKFLAKIGESLVRLDRKEDVIKTIVTKVGQFLQVDRCMLDEVDTDNQTIIIYPDYHHACKSLAGEVPLYETLATPFEKIRSGGCLVVNNIFKNPLTKDYTDFYTRFDVASLISIPWIKEGKCVCSFTVTSKTTHRWTSEEVNLLQMVADLTWLALERIQLAQDLEQTKERFHIALKNSPILVFNADSDLRYTWIYNPYPGFTVEQIIGKRDDQILDPADAQKLISIKREVLKTGNGIRREINLQINGQEHWYDITLEPLLDDAHHILGVTGSATDITERLRTENEMRRSATDRETQGLILQNRERERLHLAQDLHDGPLQELMAIGFDLADALQIDGKEERLSMLNSLRSNLHGLTAELRQFCSELRPPALAPFGLEKAIRSHLQNFETNYENIKFSLELMPDGQSLSETVRLALFRIYQELLSNIIRHSSATQVDIHLTLDEAQTELEIRDNGCGFNNSENWLDLARNGHFGLLGIKERTEALGGKVYLRSRLGEGTLIRIIIPNVDSCPDSRD
jgi:PAS domain S-box-containing protein